MSTSSKYEIAQKWAFGMAPPKAETQRRRLCAAADVARLINGGERGDEALDQISEVKGLFSRVWKQDQWDWFTVSAQLGYPSARISRVIADSLAELRKDVRDGRDLLQSGNRLALRRLPLRRCLAVFIGQLRLQEELGAGWVYYLSTRTARDIAKIGMTTRTVEERVREINGATGVVEPYGIRACWRVRDPAAAERLVHTAFDAHRVRSDREFFRVDFREARGQIDMLLRRAGVEIRTLDALTVLDDQSAR